MRPPMPRRRPVIMMPVAILAPDPPEYAAIDFDFLGVEDWAVELEL